MKCRSRLQRPTQYCTMPHTADAKMWPCAYVCVCVCVCEIQHDAVTNVRKAKSLYISRQQEYDKMKEQAAKAETESQYLAAAGITAVVKPDSKVEKRKKQEDDALQKVCTTVPHVDELCILWQKLLPFIFENFYVKENENWIKLHSFTTFTNYFWHRDALFNCPLTLIKSF